MASTDRPQLIRPSAPAQRTGEVDAPPSEVSLVKRARVSLAKRPRVELRKHKRTRPGPGAPPDPPRRVPTPTRVFAAVTAAPGRGARATRAWARRPSGRMVLPGVLMALVVAVAAAGGAWLPEATGAEPIGPPPGEAATPTGGAQAPDTSGRDDPSRPARPSGSASAGGGVITGPAAEVLAAWASPMSVRTTIPLVALEAYALAELGSNQRNPGCNLRWTTLAGIGRNESNHGRSGNAVLGNDGRSSPPIYGPPLDGTAGNRQIPDTDRGELDGDTTWDRAIGPLQFIPTTWKRYAVDADNNGTADPHDIDDAALAAANYLCAGGRNLATAEGWWAAILAYNNVQTYAENVFTAANDYGLRSRA